MAMTADVVIHHFICWRLFFSNSFGLLLSKKCYETCSTLYIVLLVSPSHAICSFFLALHLSNKSESGVQINSKRAIRANFATVRGQLIKSHAQFTKISAINKKWLKSTTHSPTCRQPLYALQIHMSKNTSSNKHNICCSGTKTCDDNSMSNLLTLQSTGASWPILYPTMRHVL